MNAHPWDTQGTSASGAQKVFPMGCLLLPEAPSLEQLLQEALGTPRTVPTSKMESAELGTAVCVPSLPGPPGPGSFTRRPVCTRARRKVGRGGWEPPGRPRPAHP